MDAAHAEKIERRAKYVAFFDLLSARFGRRGEMNDIERRDFLRIIETTTRFYFNGLPHTRILDELRSINETRTGGAFPFAQEELVGAAIEKDWKNYLTHFCRSRINRLKDALVLNLFVRHAARSPRCEQSLSQIHGAGSSCLILMALFIREMNKFEKSMGAVVAEHQLSEENAGSPSCPQAAIYFEDIGILADLERDVQFLADFLRIFPN